MIFSVRLTRLTSIAWVIFLSGVVATSDDIEIGLPQQQEENNAVGRSIDPWPPATSNHPSIQDLSREYNTIFRHGNRNAASHLWSTFLLERAPQMAVERLQFFFSGFCAVSGSQVRPSDYNRYRLTLPLVGAAAAAADRNTTTKVTGFMHYCCWPCVCDTQDFIRVDTLDVTSRDGVVRQHYFAVIGNPCDYPERLEESFVQPFQYARGRTRTLSQAAPELKCLEGGVLKGATLSDHGYIIICMFFDAVPASSLVEDEEDDLQPWEAASQVPGRVASMEVTIHGTDSGDKNDNSNSRFNSILYQDERDWEHQCIDRAFHGYNSGMGEIFRRVSAISPIAIPSHGLQALGGSNIDHEPIEPVEQQLSTGDPTCNVPLAEATNTEATEARQ